MSRLLAALTGAALGAIVTGVWIIAYMANVGLDSGHIIKQHDRGLLMFGGAALGFLLFAIAAPGWKKPPDPPSS